MAVISWGKPRILVKDLDTPDAAWVEFPTPSDGTTQLTTTKGQKQEAKIEGGENEDVRYGKNTYALALSIRAAKGRKKPIADEDGVVAHNYALALQPEDPETPGIVIQKSAASVEDAYTAADGASWTYTFDALKPGKDKKQITWGVITITESAGTVSKVECTPLDTADGEKFELAPAAPQG